MKILAALLLTLLVSACGTDQVSTPTGPVAPVIPFNPDAPTHATGFIKKEGTFGIDPIGRFGKPTVTVQLPESFSWVGAGFVTPTRDQKSCGSCWAFGSTQMLDGAVKIYDNKDMTLSEQEIVSYDNSSYGCQGGFFAGAFLSKNGLVLDNDCPYTATNGKCPGGMPKTFAAKPTGFANLGDGKSSPSTDEIKQALMQYGVVACDVAATSAWDNYHSGLLKGKSSRINHIVAVVGWDGAKGAWLMKNSWGSSWGLKIPGSTDGGYAYVPYGNFSLCSDAAYLEYKATPAFLQIP